MRRTWFGYSRLAAGGDWRLFLPLPEARWVGLIVLDGDGPRICWGHA